MLLPDALDILKLRLEAIDGLTVTTDPGAPVVPPMALVNDVRMDYRESFKDGAILEFEVTVFVSRADSAEGSIEARDYLSGYGNKSVRYALQTQSTGGDLLLSKVFVEQGERGESDSYVIASFTGTAHIPGTTAT